MCGIIAVFCSKKPSNKMKILNSFKILKSRGPDYGKIVFNSNGVLGFQRLCINDISTGGNQPMEEIGGAKLMCNGEIYNHSQLEKEYNIKCSSKSDCEVLLPIYKKIGFEKMVNKIDGVFAIVITDGDMVYIARDRIGVRPLYKGWTIDGDLAVASVAKCLTSFCTDVEQIPPSIVSYNKRTKDYKVKNWTFDLYLVPNPSSLIRNTLTDAVKKRLLTDRPIGCLLSGGLDSSLVASILCRQLGSKNVRTYSIGMQGSTDLKYAQQVSDYLGTHHTEVIFTPQEGIETIPLVIKTLESYDITTVRASVGMYLLCKYIKENTNDKVIFSGEGSDELLCGYLYFHFAPSSSELSLESIRLIRNLYLYDVLRADRTVSVHGLELRVPFLDKNFVNLAISLSGSIKMPLHGYEKYALRDAFRESYLPDSVLWRRKEGFSDGVSGVKKSWYKYIQEYVDTKITDQDFKSSDYISKESMWYRQVFDIYFPNYKPEITMWMPKWVETKDPSGRVTGAYDEKEI
jgi:asparagine synthase (glutamine-hydrolysing)